MVGLRMALVGVVHNMKVYMLDNKLLHILLGMRWSTCWWWKSWSTTSWCA